MNLPNYKDGSILNLTASIEKAFGGNPKYSPLKILPPEELKESENIALILIDGLGYEFLMKNKDKTNLTKHLRGKITSVFPSATSAAIPALMTGLSPQEHGMSAWYSFIKELGTIISPLPFQPRLGPFPLEKVAEIKDLFHINPIPNRIKTSSFIVQGSDISHSKFSTTASGKAKIIPYNSNSMKRYFSAIKKIIKSSNKRKYIFAYWSAHDSLCHKYGTKSKPVLNHFKKLNRELESFIKSIKNTNTTLIITADHGLIDVPKSKSIDVKNHPKLAECLSIPICGEGRISYCYVKPSKVNEFRKYVKTKLKSVCSLHKSQDLLKKNYFGLFKPHKNFHNRIGDYILITKENYGIKDSLINSKVKRKVGRHGGTSKEEMHVPLIIIKS